MPDLIEEDKPLPQFRKDLELYPGPEESDGSPTFNLYDPVRAKFFKLNWGESLIIQFLKKGMTLDELKETIDKKTTLQVTKDEIKYYLLDAFRHDLLSVMKTSEHYDMVAEKRKMGPFKWLLFNYLYIRIPLLNPDNFLTNTVRYVEPLASPIAFAIYTVLSLTGLFLLFTRLDTFINTFTYFFNIEGFFIYAVSISCVKVIHEFSHAYTAKHFGVRVPSMGVALIVLWPVLYTDVTDGWKLKKRSQRFYISAAGIIAELIIAGLATIGWAFSEPGYFQSVCFVIASITWVSTLVINLNPAIRFDGYYILGDLWGIDNLQQRAFTVARWKLRQILLGIDMPCPDRNLTRDRLYGFIFYSIYTWIYRVSLYTTIAIFVYFKFTKALGVFLFFMEIGVFLIWPISSEIHALAQLRGKITRNPRIMLTSFVLMVLVGWFVLPLPHELQFPAITAPLSQQIIYIPYDSVVKNVYVKRSEMVKKDQPLVELYSRELNATIATQDIQKKLYEKHINILSLNEKDRPYIAQSQAELATTDEKLKGFLQTKKELTIKSDIDGELYLWDTSIRRGQYVQKDRVIGKIADLSKISVIAYIPENQYNDIHEGQEVVFRIPSTNEKVNGIVESINPVRASGLPQPALGTTYGGDIPVSQDQQGTLRIVDSYYTAKIKLEPTDVQLRFGQRGYIQLQGPWRSKFMSFIQWGIRIFWRESGV
ncbi:MAG: efflux RND transporter periplasmic adaptor subunit [Chlamydiales bacterium]|nr:efflux RND transporter periplasmic adaptor subunit [Chlamydiia bacterium]MCP5507692.1 efflux RND transporter periplasmic adaptor subunit [Chlamydiales bacterium]